MASITVIPHLLKWILVFARCNQHTCAAVVEANFGSLCSHCCSLQCAGWDFSVVFVMTCKKRGQFSWQLFLLFADSQIPQ